MAGEERIGAPDVTPWPGVELLGLLTGGVRNAAYRARRGREALVVRVSGRSAASLAWELDLLHHLSEAGVRVPVAVDTAGGERHHRGVLVQRFIAGRPPRGPSDWRRVVEALQIVHRATVGWPQRPGFASAADLMQRSRGGDVDLGAMPVEAVEIVRGGWRPVVEGEQCVVHGDVGAGNVLVREHGRVALIDWDEARVDVPAFDWAHVPPDVPVPVGGDRRTVVTAGVAWEAATCWDAEPDYAARRLAELRTLTSFG